MATTTRPVGPFPRPRAVAHVPDATAVHGATDRLDGWRDLIREHFVALDVNAQRDTPFDGAVRSSLVGHLAVATVDSTDQECVRTPGLARHDPDD